MWSLSQYLHNQIDISLRWWRHCIPQARPWLSKPTLVLTRFLCKNLYKHVSIPINYQGGFIGLGDSHTTSWNRRLYGSINPPCALGQARLEPTHGGDKGRFGRRRARRNVSPISREANRQLGRLGLIDRRQEHRPRHDLHLAHAEDGSGHDKRELEAHPFQCFNSDGEGIKSAKLFCSIRLCHILWQFF